MRIGVTSQNRRSVTGHAGRCRRFWIYDVRGGQVEQRALLELDRMETLHQTAPRVPDQLQGIDLLVTAQLCDNLKSRLKRHGITALETPHGSPDAAVRSLLDAPREAPGG